MEQRVRSATARRREAGEASSDPMPGLVVSDAKAVWLVNGASPFSDILDFDGAAARGAAYDETVEWLLSEVEAEADVAEKAGELLRLRALERRFGLDAQSLEILVVALAPEVDRRFEQLYGYLNDDITRRRATVGLALELVGMPLASVAARRLVGPGAPLVRRGLVVLEGADRPWPGRELQVPDRVAGWCLGHDAPDPDVASVAELSGPRVPDDAPVPDVAPALGSWLEQHEGIVYLREAPGASGRWLGTMAWAAAGMPALVCHLDRITHGATVVEVAAAAAREAALQGAGLVAGPIDVVDGPVRAVVEAVTRVPGGVVLHGRGRWDESWSRSTPVVMPVPLPTVQELAPHWDHALRDAPLAPGLDATAATAQFRLSPEQVWRAAEVARGQAELAGGTIDATALRAGAREHNNPGLERLAQRIEPAVGWSDLVLPDAVASHLREIVARAGHRDTVLGQWGMRPGGRRGRGVVALFCGVSGTGKTMSAEVLAGELGIDLYVVDLASVVDKYVGETEKNLERVFSEADGVGGVLLFDEADALFAKRSEVRGANDRYANVEVAYLLQRMERFDGLALLSTNLRSNIDDAFVRRLDAIVEFPTPDAVLRRSLWERSLTAAVPRGDDLDLGFLAESFSLTGGNIRSVCLSAAYAAADSGEPVTMAVFVRCLAREYRKLGRLCTEAEFGRYWPLVAE
ncbi:MAG TPA: ATP-binding protein [Acidimicrobiales bacterium]|nr:ATP-binding protein [Acidimicrobiales bacterium]